MTNLFNPPPTAVLPLSLGRDVVLTFRNQVPGSNPATYTNFPTGVTVKVVIGKGSTAIQGVATISGDTAVCRIESENAD